MAKRLAPSIVMLCSINSLLLAEVMYVASAFMREGILGRRGSGLVPLAGCLAPVGSPGRREAIFTSSCAAHRHRMENEGVK